MPVLTWFRSFFDVKTRVVQRVNRRRVIKRNYLVDFDLRWVLRPHPFIKIGWMLMFLFIAVSFEQKLVWGFNCTIIFIRIAIDRFTYSLFVTEKQTMHAIKFTGFLSFFEERGMQKIVSFFPRYVRIEFIVRSLYFPFALFPCPFTSINQLLTLLATFI